MTPRVAFQGEPGAFSEEAVTTFFGPVATAVPLRTFEAVAEAVGRREIEYGLLPIENSIAGTVVRSLDVLGGGDLIVVGEVVRPIRHCLLGLPGATVTDLKTVRSHPVALAQCESFFRAHPHVEAVAAYDTAGAAREVAAGGDTAVGAIAGRGAAPLYALSILASDVQDRSDNRTRFLVVASPGGELPSVLALPPAPEDKAAIFFETPNRPGALLAVLEPLARSGMNLTKLESRPGEVPWTYRFYAEFEFGEAVRAPQAVLEDLGPVTTSLRLAGLFRRGAVPEDAK